MNDRIMKGLKVGRKVILGNNDMLIPGNGGQ